MDKQITKIAFRYLHCERCGKDYDKDLNEIEIKEDTYKIKPVNTERHYW